MLSIARSVVAFGFAAVIAVVIPASAMAQDEKCGVRVDRPHPSGTASAQIHTRVESFCKLVPVESNRVSATTYRERWFGWERLATAESGLKVTDRLRVTVAVDCEPGTEHRWRTGARGVVVIAGETYSAGAYEENDAPIICRG